MRLNEICQLNVTDVSQTDTGTWFIRVDDSSDDKNVKNQFSKRDIPLHPELIKIGFLDFLKLRAHKGSKLFPDLRRSERGYHSERMSRWFNEGFLRNVAKTPTTSFHSFSHSFRDALRCINAPPDVVQGLGGWRMEEGESARYGKGLRADKLAPWIERIAYEGLDLSHLYAKS
jgi:integrase